MDKPKLGLVLPFMRPFPLPEYVALAREAEARGYHMAWTGEAAGPDAVTTMALLASHTTRLHAASGIIPIQTRTPQLLGMTAATLGHVAPGRMALGLGVSSRIIIGEWNGLPFEQPLQQLREAVQLIRLVLSGEKVNFEGAHYRARNFRLGIPPPPRPVPIYLGALGPRMLELAGELADGVLLNWLAPESVPNSIRHIEAGARRAGRSLADFELAAFIRTTVTEDVEATRAGLAREITQYAIVDSYARFFAECGYGDEVETVNAAWKAGDRAAAVKQISPRFLDGLGAVGSADFARDRIAQYAGAGLTQPVVLPFAPGSDAGPTVLRTVRAFGRDPE